MNETEGLAALRILIAVAKADGKLLDEERNALEHALEGTSLPAGVELGSLLADEPDLEDQIQRITSEEARHETYQAAVGLAYIDGECAPAEAEILERLKFAFEIDTQKATFWRELAAEAKDTLLPTHIKAVKDAAERSMEVREDTLKYSIMSAVLGAFPVPGVAIATDVAVVALQAKLVRDIGQYYGSAMDKKAVSSLLGGIVGGAGMRIAVNNLVKLVPGWERGGRGDLVRDDLGHRSRGDEVLRERREDDPAELREQFKAAKKEGQAAYDQNKTTVDAKSSSARGRRGAQRRPGGEAHHAGRVRRQGRRARMSAPEKLRVLGVAGSLRKGSFNRALLRAAIELAPAHLAIETHEIGGLPHYDQDAHADGYPAEVAAFREAIAAVDGVLVVTPEYNYSIPGVLKNALDWASRPPSQPCDGKPLAIMGASGGVSGTMRAQYHLRQVAVFLNMFALNKPEVFVARAAEVRRTSR